VSQALERIGLSGWDEYAELARELDAVRAAETARTDGVRVAAAQFSEQVEQLDVRLREQGTNLTQPSSSPHRS
jgi:hypothetical protein